MFNAVIEYFFMLSFIFMFTNFKENTNVRFMSNDVIKWDGSPNCLLLQSTL